jgi:hypothetical protein
MADTHEDKEQDRPAEGRKEVKPQETQPAEEWGERHAYGKAVARGGKESGDVPGTGEQKS